MQINHLRASTINTYRDCPWKFYLHYVIGFTSVANKKATLGTIVHHVLELLANARKLGYTKLYERKLTNPDYLLKICWERYKRNFSHLFDFLPEDYEFCEKQIRYVLDSEFNPIKLHILDTEKQFEIEVQHPSCVVDYTDFVTGECQSGYMTLRGTIDLITEVNDDTIEIIDYKTGLLKDWITGKPKTFDDFLKDIQLRMYDLATNVIYSKYKNRLLTIIYTQAEAFFTVTFDTKDYKESLDTLFRYYTQIVNDNTYVRLRDNKKRFRTESFKCHYVCQFGKIAHDFQSEDGEIITETFKIILPKWRHLRDYPQEIVRDGVVYTRITDKDETLCDRYYKIIKSNGVRAGSQKLHQISLDQALLEKQSRRNDYNRVGIFKGKLSL